MRREFQFETTVLLCQGFDDLPVCVLIIKRMRSRSGYRYVSTSACAGVLADIYSQSIE